MAWLKRSAGGGHGANAEKRGWGNGIPPWMRHRIVVLPLTPDEMDRRFAKL